MDSLQFFIEQLYDQPSEEEERIAWRAVLLGDSSLLWSHCLALTGNPDGRSLLNRLWEQLWDPRADAQVEKEFAPHLPPAALLKSARQLVAASIVAHLCLHESAGQNAALATELRQWAQRAVAGQTVPAPPADLPDNSPLHNWIELDPVERVLQVYAQWDDSARGEGWVAARHASCHIVRRNPPAASRRQSIADRQSGVSALRVPVLLDCRNETGAVIWLCLQQGEAGQGFAHALSDSMRCLDTTFLDSLREVAKLVRSEYGSKWDKDVMWWLENLPADVPLEGDSAMGAAGVGLLHLLWGLPYDARYVVSATVSKTDACLGGVRGFESPHYAKMAAAQQHLSCGQTITILLHRNSFTDQKALANYPNVRVDYPEDLEEAFKICTELSGGVLRYLRAVVACPDGPGIQLALGDRTLAQLYVFPDFLHSEPRPDAENGRGDSDADNSRDRTQMDIEEQSLFLEQVREVEKRLTWQQTRKSLDAPARRAVLLASPGQGKTAWTLMAARELAAQSAEMLLSGTHHDQVVVPLVIALKELLEGVTIGARDNTGEILRRRLRELVRGLAPDLHDVAADEVVTGVLSERGWLFLDGLDEVSTDPTTTATLHRLLEVLANWQCRVIITSRPYGYSERQSKLQKLLTDLKVYFLASLNDEQRRQLVAQWYGDSAPPDGRERLHKLLQGNPAARMMAQNPFLLTQLCALGENLKSVTVDTTRTKLYTLTLELMLGGEDRAGEWMPLLEELAQAMFRRNASELTLEGIALLDLFQESENQITPEGCSEPSSKRVIATHLRDELLRKRILVRVKRQGEVENSRGRMYAFGHKTICEFLMAGSLVRMMEPRQHEGNRWLTQHKSMPQNILKSLDQQALQQEWEQVFLFLAGKLAHPKPLLVLLAENRKDTRLRHRLGLAAQCLAELDPHVREAANTEVNRISTDLFQVWWSHNRRDFYSAIDGIHLDRALSALVRVNGLVLEWEDYQFESPLRQWLGNLFPIRQIRRFLVANRRPMHLLNLLAILLQDGDRNIRWMAVQAVKGIGAAASQAEFLHHLSLLLEDWKFSREAASAVRGIGAAAATVKFLDSLAQLLLYGNFSVCESVAWAVGGMGPAAARDDILAGLTRLLRDSPCQQGKIAAARAIGEIGPAAARDDILAELARMLRDQDQYHERGKAAIAAVRRIGVAAARSGFLDEIARLLQDEDACFRAVLAMEGMGAAAAREDILDGLARLLQHRSLRVRRSAAEALSHLK